LLNLGGAATDASSISFPANPSLPEQDVSPSSANCATEIGNYAGRDRFDIENWKRFKWQSESLECHGEMRLGANKTFRPIGVLLIIFTNVVVM